MTEPEPSSGIKYPAFQNHEWRGRRCVTCNKRQCTGFGKGKCPCCGRTFGEKGDGGEDPREISRPSDQGI